MSPYTTRRRQSPALLAALALGPTAVACSGQIDGAAVPDPSTNEAPRERRPGGGDQPIQPGDNTGQPPPGPPASPGPATGFGDQAKSCEATKAVIAASARLHSPTELRATFAAFAAPATVAWDIPPEFPRVDGLTNDQANFTVTPSYLASVAENARALAAQVAGRAPFDATGCTADVPASCADDVLAPLGRLLWRRPLSGEEKAWLVRHLKGLPAGLTSRERVEAAARMLLLAPQALFRFEGLSAGPLDPWQKADAIAYAMTGGPPDSELATAADTGALRQASAVREQIQRLASRPAFKARMTQFVQDGYEVHDVESVKKDGKKFPEFTPAFARTTRASFEAFSSTVFTGEGRTFEALFTTAMFADTTGPRAGLFTHPAFLMSQADEEASRPLHRARAVLERALCVHFPDPPDSAAGAKPIVDPTLSPRQRFEKLTSPPECAGCHRTLNPVGFALDGYDAIGKPRATLEGFPIDTTGVVPLDDATVTFDGPPQLMAALAASRSARECFVTRAYRHVAGRADTTDDLCLKTRSFATLQTSGNVRESFAETLFLFVEAARRAP